MDGIPQPADLDMRSFGNYAHFSTPSPGSQETLGGLQPFGGSQDVLHDNNLALNKFIHDFKNESWNPLRANSHGFGGRQPLGVPMNFTTLNFPAIYRNTTVPSECSTVVPSDSGYGTLANPSVSGDTDHNTETQSLIVPLSNLQLPAGSNTDAMPSADKHRQRRAWNRGAATNLGTNPLICPSCDAAVRTQSELTKHEQRHAKPFRCDEPGCLRSKEGSGFSTNNDLLRHKQSVHRADGTKYRCDISQCRTRFKAWPRADNFRSHLKKIHNYLVGPNDDLERFILQPPMRSESVSLHSSEAIAPDMDTHPHLDSTPHMPWVGLEPSRLDSMASPGGFTGQMGSMMQLTSHPRLMDEQDFSTLTGAGGIQVQDQASLDNINLQLDMDPVMSELNTPQGHLPVVEVEPPLPEESAPGSHSCIAPDMLSRSGMQSRHSSGQRDIGRQQEADEDRDSTFAQEEDRTGQEDEPNVLQQPGELERDAAIEDASLDADADDDLEDTHSPYEVHYDKHITLPPLRDTSEGVLEGFTPLKYSGSPQTTKATDSYEEMADHETDARDLIKRLTLMNPSVLDKVILELGYQKSKEAEAKSKKNQASLTPLAANTVPCPTCGKSFQRPCELKKHEKRHIKPYACTFPRCGKSFGSKNDWKRHENSQHFQLEVWRCDMKSNNEECGRVCHRRETLKLHLEKDHEITDQKNIEEKWNSCRIGRNCETRFWCGFCEKTIEFKNNGAFAWTERFDHIDDHYSGRAEPKMDISKWKDVDADITLNAFELAPGKNARRAKQSPEDSGPPTRHSDKPQKRSAESSDDDFSQRAKRAKAGNDVFWSCVRLVPAAP
ncbi:hypothetical protein B0T26DRAFT_178543 [Lasiosphaeria miniovina]|uniref:C2H2-type domain-containing protein n=1 Tax=Lasiosphaeria miniovina TaxID=1954250 RepID=A0AA40EAR4_9PEZI|nr:uncharacterized protein B0T26DRAFT_178543 [Lasiosphaeria miniovina]KAK0728598.1 hypothetical protein B0T26DRAFT_178543 [Lasiosphaeria miniovina]